MATQVWTNKFDNGAKFGRSGFDTFRSLSTETIEISETHPKQILLVFSETINISDTKQQDFSKIFTETVNISEYMNPAKMPSPKIFYALPDDYDLKVYRDYT